MIYGVFALRDECSQEFLTPTIEQSDARAIRNLESAVKAQQAKQDGIFFSHPSDFSLYLIAEYDSESGQIVSRVPHLVRKVGEI